MSAVLRRQAVVIASFAFAVSVIAPASAAAGPTPPYRDPAYAFALQQLIVAHTPQPYAADEAGMPESEKAAHIRHGLWRARVASGALPPLSTVGQIELPGETPHLFGWWIRRDTAPFELFDRKYLPLTGDLGRKPPLMNYVSRYVWVADPSNHRWVLGFVGAGYSVFFNPSTCIGRCFPSLFGTEYNNAVNTAAEAWLYFTGPYLAPGQTISVPCSGAPVPLNASGCFGRVLSDEEMASRIQAGALADFTTQRTEISSWPNKTLVYDAEAARAVLDGDDVTAAWVNHELDPSYPDPFVEAPLRVPLIFVPGIMGSELWRGETQLWPEGNFLPGRLGGLLLNDEGEEVGEPLRAIDVVRKVEDPVYGVYAKHVYDATIAAFEDAGYREEETLFPFPYDWRLSADDNAAKLLDRIRVVLGFTHAAKVDIVAHSQGGLVVRSMLARPESVGLVRRVLTLGTPVLGAPKALGTLEFGDPCPLPLVCILDQVFGSDGVRTLVRNMPGVYELLPSRLLQGLIGSPYIQATGGDEVPLAYDEWRDVVAAHRNSLLTSSSDEYHVRFDRSEPVDSSVTVRRVVGVGLPTLNAIRIWGVLECLDYFGVCDDRVLHDLITGENGDGTVPQKSADFGARSTYAVVEHMGLARDSCVLTFAVGYFDGGDPPLSCTAQTQAFRMARAGAASTRLSEEPIPFSGIQVETIGPITSAVVDQDHNTLGRLEGDPLARLEIPGGVYDEIADTQSFTLTGNGLFELRGEVSAVRPVHLYVRRFADNELVDQAVFYLPSATSGAVLRLPFAAGQNLAGLRLSVDLDADGSADEQRAPDSLAVGAAATDTTSPSTIAGASLLSDGVSTVVLAASDTGGSGVDRTLYLSAAGPAQVYTTPFAAPVGSVVKFRSVDRAGNLETVRELLVDDAPNERTLAASIEDKANLKRLIDPTGDVDWYRFEVEQESDIRVSLTALHADYDLELRDADGTVLAAPHERSKRAEQIVLVLGAGTYYVHVSGDDGASDAEHRYELKLKIAPPEPTPSSG